MKPLTGAQIDAQREACSEIIARLEQELANATWLSHYGLRIALKIVKAYRVELHRMKQASRETPNA